MCIIRVKWQSLKFSMAPEVKLSVQTCDRSSLKWCGFRLPRPHRVVGVSRVRHNQFFINELACLYERWRCQCQGEKVTLKSL